MPATGQRAGLTRRQALSGAALLGMGLVLQAAVRTTRAAHAEPLDERVKIAHLLRRAGFGASPRELAEYQALGLSGAVDRLVNYEQVPNVELEVRLNEQGLDLSDPLDLRRWWVLRMVHTARPLEEKMVLFWHGLLTSSLAKAMPPLMLAQNQFFRAHALDDFPSILKGISRDPAMMRWLDLETNRKGHANENFARELMELFTLGVGNYTEQDVREVARAFTGWALDRSNPEAPAWYFNQNQHDSGLKTILGQTGAFTGDDAIDIIVRQPAAARFISTKLFRFFAYPDPEPEVIDDLAATFTSSGFSIRAVVQRILSSDAFFSDRAYRAIIKSPTDLVVGTARTLELETIGTPLVQAIDAMGQTLLLPPNVAGWPGGPAWMGTGAWLARMNFANRVSSGQVGTPAPGSLLTQLGSGGDPVGTLVDGLLDGVLGQPQRDVLASYLAAAPDTEERQRGLVYLAMALPEYHLA